MISYSTLAQNNLYDSMVMLDVQNQKNLIVLFYSCTLGMLIQQILLKQFDLPMRNFWLFLPDTLYLFN